MPDRSKNFILWFNEIGIDDVPMVGDRSDKHDLASAMSEAWIAFARSGDPSHQGIPEWKPYTLETPRVLEIGDEIVLHDRFRQERIAYHVAQGKFLLERSTR